MPLGISCTTEEKVKVTAAPMTEAGAPAPIEGALNVTVASGDGTVEPATKDDGAGNQVPDPLAFWAVSGDAPGVTIYNVSGDADLGEGVVTLEDTVTLTVVGALAFALGLFGGDAEPKAAPGEPPARRGGASRPVGGGPKPDHTLPGSGRPEPPPTGPAPRPEPKRGR